MVKLTSRGRKEEKEGAQRWREEKPSYRWDKRERGTVRYPHQRVIKTKAQRGKMMNRD